MCFQRSIPGSQSPEILVHITFETGSVSFSGLPLGPPSINGWSTRAVARTLAGYVAITPRVRQRLHRAVDRNPWGQATEASDDVAVWVVNLTDSASSDLLLQKDNVHNDTDCRWIPSNTALSVDSGGLRRAQTIASVQTSGAKAAVHRQPTRLRRRPLRSHRRDRTLYCTEVHNYPPSPGLRASKGPLPPPSPPACQSATNALVSRWHHITVPPPPSRVPVLLPHLAAPPLEIAQWHSRVSTPPPRPLVMTVAVATALADPNPSSNVPLPFHPPGSTMKPTLPQWLHMPPPQPTQPCRLRRCHLPSSNAAT